MGVDPEPSPVSGGRVTRPVRSGWGGGGGPGGHLGVGKARPGPRSYRALPEHPAEVAVPRVVPRRGQGALARVPSRRRGRPEAQEWFVAGS